ncbi:MAG: flagellar filament capping protein FliD [Deltaproteobacteria bacterium]|nr:flagellar filament capping protein FliD [Deltaproteobacteria bacterium]
MAGTVTLTGLVSDLNWTKLIDDLISAKKAYIITPYKDSKTKYENKLSAWRELNTKLSEIVNYVKTKELYHKKGYQVFTYTLKSSDGTVNPESLIGIRLTTQVQNGSYDVKILSLAQAEKLSSDSIATKNEPLSLSGVININGMQVEIEGDDTLLDIAYKINNGNTGVVAKVITLSETEHRLILESEKEGESGITLSDPNGIFKSLGIIDEAGIKKNVIRQGQNSLVHIDGFQVESTSNTLTGVIPGMTLYLKGQADSVQVTISVKEDVQTITDTFEGLISRLNALLTFINRQSKYTEGGKKSLTGDVNLNMVRNGIVGAVYTEIEGNTSFKTLSSIGITFGRDGMINLDNTKFSEALGTGKTEVITILTKFGESVYEKLNFLIDPYSGTFIRIEDAIENQISRIDRRIKELEERLQKERDVLEKKYSALEVLISRSNLIRGWMENQIKAMFKKD